MDYLRVAAPFREDRTSGWMTPSGSAHLYAGLQDAGSPICAPRQRGSASKPSGGRAMRHPVYLVRGPRLLRGWADKPPSGAPGQPPRCAKMGSALRGARKNTGKGSRFGRARRGRSAAQPGGARPSALAPRRGEPVTLLGSPYRLITEEVRREERGGEETVVVRFRPATSERSGSASSCRRWATLPLRTRSSPTRPYWRSWTRRCWSASVPRPTRKASSGFLASFREPPQGEGRKTSLRASAAQGKVRLFGGVGALAGGGW
jgi:hypothetical protein